MERVSFFFDGFNVYHSLSKIFRKYLWLNYKNLAECYLRKNQQLSSVYYFTALAHWLGEPALRHQIYIGALEAEGVTVVLGKFKKKERHCHLCGKDYEGHEEKQTDVNIVSYLIRGAYKKDFDTAFIITNDTDMIPAIKIIKQDLPTIKIGVMFPINRYSAELEQHTDFKIHIREPQLAASQLNNPYILPNGKYLYRPPGWQ